MPTSVTLPLWLGLVIRLYRATNPSLDKKFTERLRSVPKRLRFGLEAGTVLGGPLQHTRIRGI